MKVSLAVANIANRIEQAIADVWPELAAEPIDDVWFTGSRVWGLLYPDLPERFPPLERDWDIFTLTNDAAVHVVTRLGLNGSPACRTQDKRRGAERTVSPSHIPEYFDDAHERGPETSGGYDDGYSYQTPRGIVDLWVSREESAIFELRTYPEASHAHCRAAFSFTDGLIVLPNDLARLSC